MQAWTNSVRKNKYVSGYRVAIVQRQEWSWILAWSVVILGITSLPYLYGALISTTELQFGGFVIGVEDGNSYLAKMQQGWSGNWLFHLVYTPEPHRGELFFIYYLLLGKLAKALGLSLVSVLHLSRLITIPFGLLSFYYFAAFFTADVSLRRTACLLFGLTAGLGWLWVSLGLPAELGAMPIDLWVPDASFFLASFTFPHLPLAQGLLLWIVVGGLRYLAGESLTWWAISAGAGFLVSLIHPYTLPILTTILGIYSLSQAYLQNWPLWRSVRRLTLIALPSLPYLIYVLVVFETNSVFRAWRDQSLTLSPNPIHYLLGFGLVIPLAVIGFWQASKVIPEHAQFLKIWLLVIPFLVYLPLALQRRFIDGYQSPLALLGAVGLVWLIQRLTKNKMRLLATAVSLMVMALTNLLLLVGGMAIVNSRQSSIFHSRYEQEAFDWLADNAREQIVLSAYETGNLLPAYAPVRVFVGHGPETVQSEAKRAMLKEFFNDSGDHKFRRQLLQDYAVTYLIYGPEERALGGFSPSEVSYLTKVYDNGVVQIYRVIGTDDDQSESRIWWGGDS